MAGNVIILLYKIRNLQFVPEAKQSINYEFTSAINFLSNISSSNDRRSSDSMGNATRTVEHRSADEWEKRAINMNLSISIRSRELQTIYWKVWGPRLNDKTICIRFYIYFKFYDRNYLKKKEEIWHMQIIDFNFKAVKWRLLTPFLFYKTNYKKSIYQIFSVNFNKYTEISP